MVMQAVADGAELHEVKELVVRNTRAPLRLARGRRLRPG